MPKKKDRVALEPGFSVKNTIGSNMLVSPRRITILRHAHRSASVWLVGGRRSRAPELPHKWKHHRINL